MLHTISVPEKDYSIFLEISKRFKWKIEKRELDISIPEAHKQIVRDRIAKADKNSFTSWNDFKKELDNDE